MHKHFTNINQQTGAVLLISMIMLLLLSLIGATGMQVTTLEEKMAGNSRDSNLAFQNAETTLRGVEKLLNSSTPVFDNTKGYYIYNSSKELWNTVDWSSSEDTKTYTLTLGGVSPKSPRYIVEELTASQDPDGPIDTGNPLDSKYYRITTRAYGATDSSIVLLQSVYKR